jgi:putative methionine-R-sulfoxide reductase with GAF domain
MSRRRHTVAGSAAAGSAENATAAADKLARFQAVTDAALSRLGVEDLLTELLNRTCELLSVDTATVFLLNTTDTELIAAASSGAEDEVRLGVRIPVGSGLAGRVAVTGTPLTVDHIDPSTVASPVVLESGIATMAGVPLIRSGSVVGVLQIGSRSSRTFTDDDVELLQLVADRASSVVRDRSAALDRAAALALQRSLLPDHPEHVPGLDVAVRYAPGTEAGVGGDWYDLFVMPTGHIGITIGDVAGSGLRAAVVMGRIRSALRAYALETLDPADVLTRLDLKIRRFEPEAMATVLYAVIDPDHACMQISNAGHLPPIVTEPGRPNRILEVPPDVPVGAFIDEVRRSSRHGLAEGAGILFYTDGLVETRTEPVTRGIEILADALSGDTAEAMCFSAMTTVFGQRPVIDDVALLAVRRAPDHIHRRPVR